MSNLAHIVASALALLATLFFAAAAASVNPLPHFFATKPTAHATILFGGDMMFDRFIRNVAEKKGGDFIFSCLDTLLKSEELVVANLEGPITDNASKSMGTAPGADGNYTFTFPTSTPALLFAHNIRLVNIGNNHIENFGLDGVRSTIAALSGARIDYFGDTIDRTMEAKDIGGVPLAFINYNEFVGGAASTTVMQIQAAREQGMLPIVYAHWGIEYATTSPARIRVLARLFVDSGAELIIGSHPHVIEEREFYREKYIYYSLGNLIFDQYFDEDVRRGLMVRVVFDARGVQYVERVPFAELVVFII